MSGPEGGRSRQWQYPRIVLVIGPPGPTVEAALRRIGFVPVCQAVDASVWTPPSGGVEAVVPLDGWQGPAELRLCVGAGEEQLALGSLPPAG